MNRPIRALLVLVLIVGLGYPIWAMYTEATVGCFAPPFTLDACRDPYGVRNETDGAVTIYRADASGREVKLLSLSPGWLPLQIGRDGPRCQEGFNLVARDTAGREIARQDRWCRYDDWVITTPSTSSMGPRTVW